MRFEEPTRWELFLDGWNTILSAIDFRLDYTDNIDRCAFFEEINLGWYQMYIYPYDDWYVPIISKERRLRLAQEPEKIYLSAEAFDHLVERLNNPLPPTPEFIALMNRKAPWDE